jgi:multidrug efflux pump subunit AcrA (membrane-fusion protein)
MRFRERALRHRRSNDDLDAPMRVTNVRGWLWALALTVAVAAVVAFGFAGRLPRSIAAPGILQSPAGVVSVPAGQSGEVLSVPVHEGTHVQRGQVVAYLAGNRVVVSRFAGTVVALRVAAGQLVGPATPVVTLERFTPGNRPDALVFLNQADGGRVHRGMAVDLTVAAAPSDRYGVVRGHVETVSTTPSGADEISALLANDTLAHQFTSRGAPVIARVGLDPDSTPSGVRWSTGTGPSFRLAGGTVVHADVVESEQRPVDAVFGSG